jgi:hypothetical protein
MTHRAEHGTTSSDTAGIELHIHAFYPPYQEGQPDNIRRCECGARPSDFAALGDKALANYQEYMVEHGYTCHLCSWGRDKVRTEEEYKIHVEWDHPNGRLWR